MLQTYWLTSLMTFYPSVMCKCNGMWYETSIIMFEKHCNTCVGLFCISCPVTVIFILYKSWGWSYIFLLLVPVCSLQHQYGILFKEEQPKIFALQPVLWLCWTFASDGVFPGWWTRLSMKCSVVLCKSHPILRLGVEYQIQWMKMEEVYIWL